MHPLRRRELLEPRQRRPRGTEPGRDLLAPFLFARLSHLQPPNSGASVEPLPAASRRITAYVIAMIMSRPGNGAPAAVVVGMAAASTSEAPPRSPAQQTTVTNCQRGRGSCLCHRGLRRRK